MKQLERENREPRRANGIVKSAAASFRGSSTAGPRSDPPHRRAASHLRSRADRPGPGDRLRSTTPPARGHPRPVPSRARL